jgi:magnesium chelatase family protein
MSLDSLEDIGCTCNDMQKTRYINKLSKALKDRIDIYSYVPRVEYKEINNIKTEYISSKMKERVVRAREAQRARFDGSEYYYNSQIRGRDIYEFCRISRSVEKILENYFNNSKPSLRAYGKLIKLSRTIADLEGFKDITEGNIIEAMGFRKDYNGKIL